LAGLVALVEAEHGHRVLYLLAQRALRELGERGALGVQLLQPTGELVKLVVADLRLAQPKVAIVVVADELFQLIDVQPLDLFVVPGRGYYRPPPPGTQESSPTPPGLNNRQEAPGWAFVGFWAQGPRPAPGRPTRSTCRGGFCTDFENLELLHW